MKTTAKLISFVLIISLLWGFNTFVISPQYRITSMYASYIPKAERAESISGQKALILGGSASNLGFDSAYFESLSGIPAANMAITAGVPLRVYMKMAEMLAEPGDIVFLNLEPEYFSMDFWQIDEAYADMVDIDSDLRTDKNIFKTIQYYYTQFFRSFSRLNDNLNFKLQEQLEGGSIYIASSVDEYGDFCLHEGKPSEYQAVPATAEDFSVNEETMEQIVRFIDQMEKNDISVYVSYAPANGFKFTNYQEYYTQIQTQVESFIPKEHLIGTPFDFLYEESYFFDTEYHLLYDKRDSYTGDFYQKYVEVQQDYR